MATSRGPDVREALKWGALELEKAGIEYRTGVAAREAALLLSRCAGLSLGDIYSARRPLGEREFSCFVDMIGRRRAREPLQYIIGEQEFMSLNFRVDRRVLIPRPETELLAEIAIETLRGARPGFRFAEAGTGSGAVAISIAKYSGVSGYATDISSEALDVAVENARLNEVEERVIFARGNMLEPLNHLGLAEPLDCVVANPPYVGSAEYNTLQPEIRFFEPRLALVQDDLAGMYGRIGEEALAFLKPGGLLAVEIGSGASGVVSGAFRSLGDFENMEVRRDLSGLERVVCAWKRKKPLGD